jgi:hypothetical protein
MAAQMHLGREANGDKSTGSQPLWSWKEVGFDRARGGLRDKRRPKSGDPIHKGILFLKKNRHKTLLFKKMFFLGDNKL